MTIGMVFTLIASVLVLAGELALGQAICGALMRRIGVGAHAEDHSPLAPLFWISFLVGLFAHLFGVLMIGGIVCGTDVGQAFAVEHSSFFWGVLACAPLCLSARRWVRDRTLVAWTPTPITVSWAVWLTVISALSMSLFDAIETLSTAWPFNYGDLPFHLGMITSFVYGGNLLPEYQIYAGKGLSYPFFVNLWSALLWFPDPSFESLDVVFAVQWIVLWCAVFGLLRGDRFYLLPWAVLLGGGSFEVLAKIMTHTDWNLSGVFGGKLIREQFPWEPLLPTIWVTQRSALIGVVTLLAAVRYFHQRFSSTGVARERIIGIVLPGVTLSLGMLAHTHLFLCAFMYLGLNVGFVVLQNVWGWCSRPAVVRERLTTIIAPLLWLGLSALPTLLSVPFIWDKRGTVRFVLGWMPWTVAPESGNLGALIGSVATWSSTWAFVIPVICIWLTLLRRGRETLALALIFLYGNIVMMSIWDWDQIKFFIGLYVIFLALISTFGEWRGFGAQLSLLPLVLPGAVFFGDFLFRSDNNAIFSAAELTIAREVRNRTEHCSVLVAKPDHNSPVMLTGRRLYAGYAGWTWTHALDAEGRGTALDGTLPELIQRVASDESFRACAVYLVYAEREEIKWPDLTAALETGLLAPTEYPRLYAFTAFRGRDWSTLESSERGVPSLPTK